MTDVSTMPETETLSTSPSAALPSVDESSTRPTMPTLIEAKAVSVFYGTHEAVKGVSLTIAQNSVCAMIGPSGCGNSTFLRSINRLNDLIPGCHVKGELLIGKQNVYERVTDEKRRGEIGHDISPIYFVDAADPPTLVLAGENDPLVDWIVLNHVPDCGGDIKGIPTRHGELKL